MNFIADCSITMSWLLRDEATPATDKVLDSLGSGSTALVPALWRWEVSNVLLIAERKKRITRSEAASHLSLLSTLPIEIDESSSAQAWRGTHLLAQKHKLTSYDAAYLELAVRKGFALASLDEALRIAAKAEKIDLIPERI